MYYFREYLVDLFGDPGALSKPDSTLNRTASVFISSPLYHPRFRAVDTVENFRTLAKLYFIDNRSPKFEPDDDLSGDALGPHAFIITPCPNVLPFILNFFCHNYPN